MKKMHLPNKALVSTIVASLVLTLSPASALADETLAIQDTKSSSSSASVEASKTPDVSKTDTQSISSKDESSEDLDKICQSAIEEKDDIEVVSVSVNLADKQSEVSIVQQAGLTFAINDKDTSVPRAALLGWSAKSLKDTLAIPSSIQVNNTSYTVTNISTNIEMGGGVL
ncbi:hypothetical protein [Adlercreutzia sp. ZJ304]|uniref:hypothetical protein n=1 Tax=Adlercreutzia sp. ZJ304 TaxID=2709791 RepID=UPI0013EA5EB8|nr:hypothetical protein [Adlercreutzia sp. ZJ304]